MKKRRLTIIGDKYTPNARLEMRTLLDESQYNTTATIKNNCDTTDLVQDLVMESQKHGHRDYLIFIFNTNNVSNNKGLTVCLNRLLPISKFTNLVMLVHQKTTEDYRNTGAIQEKKHKLQPNSFH
ncbi:hypothetical protein HHI36_002143 [Cryptolaemus montrouzieri]|uniref:Uncharacterized protein n=1 Tax=Cryptolaemus montrouzieri TaxID=559131 RepID=A0ABD2PAI7_9CUCU